MAYLESYRKDGSKWTPKFVASLDSAKCIGCGRCFKACAHDVLTLEEDEDEGKMFMVIENEAVCIGCLACAKACPKGCFTHAPVEV